MKNKILISAILLTSATLSFAQHGYVTGSLESNSIAYVDDSGINTMMSDHFGSNDYLKVDYVGGRFTAGIQGEAYLPALQGFEIGQQPGAKKFFLASKYIRWQDRNFTVQAGDIYAQFGNGLIFRSHEDRQIGFNNSIEGIYGSCTLAEALTLTGLYGRPRLYTDYAESWVRGGNVNLSLSSLFKANGFNLDIEGSYINRYESLDKDNMGQMFEMVGLTTPNLDMFSGAVNFDWNFLSLKGEYAVKGKDLYAINANAASSGSAIYGEIAAQGKGLSFTGTFRRLDKMGTMLSLYGSGTGNTLNYLPALTRQYTYMLANLNPYQINTEGEIGGQADLYYSIRSKTDRHRRWNFHANFSLWATLSPEQTQSGQREKLWQDINFDVERQWGRNLKTTLLLSIQEWNPSHGFEHQTYVSNIVVGDVLYKFNKKHSIRVEAQYLYSQEYEKDWVAGLVEYSFAPRWSIFVSDMYNLGTTKKNYYNGGFSYTRSRTRVMMTYGRNRAGYICSGGVCRYSPAYTGLNLTLTTSF